MKIELGLKGIDHPEVLAVIQPFHAMALNDPNMSEAFWSARRAQLEKHDLPDPLADTQNSLQPSSASELSSLIANLPRVIASPLHDYANELHPVMKLWAACDTVELLLRFLMMTMAADHRRHGDLDHKILKALWGKIETPTLGAWMAMATTLADASSKGELLATEAAPYVKGPLSGLLYGPDKPGTIETSFIKLRNRLAHSGRMTHKEAERLLSIWQERFEEAMMALSWLQDFKLVGQDDGTTYELTGASNTLSPFSGVTLDIPSCHKDSVWLVRGDNTLPLWPMALYGRATSTLGEKGRTSEESGPQIYTRKDVVNLEFTPVGVDGFSHSESDQATLEEFQNWFRLDKLLQLSQAQGFKIQDFTQEINKDASQMVGRVDDLEALKSAALEQDNRLIWVTGSAGMGKSFLAARLAKDLLDDDVLGQDTLVLPYRFKGGDDARCNRNAFADFVVERLVASGFLMERGFIQEEKNQKAEERLENALNLLQSEKKIVFILDGLDEIHTRDPQFAKDIPLALPRARVTWFCSGRPEPALMIAFHNHEAFMPFPNGLVPMSTDDIRGMIMERIGPLRKKLLQNDKEQGDEVINPFIEQVAKRAEGVPLYVKYVINDVLGKKYRVLDGNEDLPESLQAYHEELIKRLGVGDLQAILTPLAATLAVAHEPLSRQQLHAFMRLRNLAADEGELTSKGLAAIASMLRSAPTPEGDEGFTLFHKSLRTHILDTETMAQSVQTARNAFADAALNPEEHGQLTNYLYRTGIDHLLENSQTDQAREKLLNLDHLSQMFELRKNYLSIIAYWVHLGDGDVEKLYTEASEPFLQQTLEEVNEQTLVGVNPSLFFHFSSLCQLAGWYNLGSILAKILLQADEIILGPEHPVTLTSTSDLGNLLNHKGDYEGAEELFRRAFEGRERVLGPEHPDTLTSASDLGNLLNHKGDYEGADELLRWAFEARKRVLGSEHPDTLVSANNLGTLLKHKDDYEGAEELLRWAFEGMERVLGPEDLVTLSSGNNLGNLLLDMGDYEGAEELFRRAFEGRERVLGPEHPVTLTSTSDLGNLLNHKGDYEGAEELFRRAFEGRERVLGLDHLDTLTSASDLGSVLSTKGDVEGAEALLRRALEARKRVLGPEHPDTLTSASDLGNLLVDMGDYEGAEELLRWAFEARERVLGPEHPDTLSSGSDLGNLLNHKGDYEGADELLRWAFEARKRVLGPEHLATLGSGINLGNLLDHKGDYEGAEELLRWAFEGMERVLGPEHPATLTSASDLAAPLFGMGDVEGAEELLRWAFEGRERVLGLDHLDTLTSASDLGSVLSTKGDVEGAEALLRRALEAMERVLGPEHPTTQVTAKQLGIIHKAKEN